MSEKVIKYYSNLIVHRFVFLSRRIQFLDDSFKNFDRQLEYSAAGLNHAKSDKASLKTIKKYWSNIDREHKSSMTPEEAIDFSKLHSFHILPSCYSNSDIGAQPSTEALSFYSRASPLTWGKPIGRRKLLTKSDSFNIGPYLAQNFRRFGMNAAKKGFLRDD